jgi:branched-chain amino acid transport system permease protein
VNLQGIVDTLVQGLLLGGHFALSGLGLALAFGILRIVNIAHGDLLVVAAYLGVAVVALTPLPALAAVFVVVPVMAALGWLLQRALFQRVVGHGELAPMLVTFGLSIIVHNVLQELFSADFKTLDAGAAKTASVELAGLHLGWLPLATLAAAVVVYALVHAAMRGTRFGRIVRATVDDPEIAAAFGVDTRRVYAAGMALALAIAGIAGWLYGIKSSFNPMTGGDQLLFAFETVIIGGMGSIWGSFVGGMVLGVAQVIGLHVHAGWGAFAGHLAFFAFLFLRPQGLLARGAGGDHG